MINLHVIYWFILLILFLNVISFVRRISSLKNSEKYLYTYLLISIIGWVITNAVADLSKDLGTAKLAAQLALLFPLNFMTALVNISRTFPKILSEKKPHKKIFTFFNTLTLLLTGYFLFNISSLQNVADFKVVLNGPAEYTPGILYYLSLLYAIILFGVIIWNWLSKLKKYTRTQRLQIKIILVSLGLVYVALGIGLTFFPAIGLIKYGPTAFISLGILLYLINQTFFAKAFLADINTDLAFIVALLLSSTLSAIGIDFLLSSHLQIDNLSLGILGIVFLSSMYYISNRIIQFPKRGIEDIRSKILDFSSRNSTLLIRDRIVEDAVKTLNSIFPNSTVVLDLNLSYKKPLIAGAIKWWSVTKNIRTLTTELVIEETPRKYERAKWIVELVNTMIKENISILIPIKSEKGVIGIIKIMGNQIPIKEREYELLELFMQNVSVSITRSYLYSRVKDLNQNLEQKVEEQTEELTDRFHQLVRVQQREKDMIDIMGHELRTPISIIKFQFGLMSEKIGKGTLAGKLKTHMDNINSAIQREARLINSLLGATKIDQNKLDLHFEKLKIADLISESIGAHKLDAEKKGLQLEVDIPKESSKWAIEADKTRLLEVIDNLVNNAIKYTMEGKVSLSLSRNQSEYTIIVKDSGFGISKEGLRHIGEKFYRADTEKGTKRIIRPGGTGLGLYVSFGIIKRHKGTVKVESEFGKGTTFIVKLPVKQENVNIRQNKSLNIFDRMGFSKTK